MGVEKTLFIDDNELILDAAVLHSICYYLGVTDLSSDIVEK